MTAQLITTERMPSMNAPKPGEKKKQFTGRHFLTWILAFFGVIIGMNIVFIYFATNTWTGLFKENAYVDGLNYNQTIEAAEAQKALNWNSTLELTALGNQKAITFQLSDENDVALSAFVVNAKVSRPTLQDYDQTILLAESTRGIYEATVDLPFKGQWHISISATAPDGTPFQLEQRFILK
ncbi:FixH family protein [Kiloniella sp.]|uniref:FixH family protein n=1 Tax=Kiloniella sp. TaxID=1938587 RepID=UPI003B02E692